MIAEFLFLKYGQEGSQRTQATTHCLLHLHGFVFLLFIFLPCFNFSFKVRRGRRSKLRTLMTRSEISLRLHPVLYLPKFKRCIAENGEDVAGDGRESEGGLFLSIHMLTFYCCRLLIRRRPRPPRRSTPMRWPPTKAEG